MNMQCVFFTLGLGTELSIMRHLHLSVKQLFKFYFRSKGKNVILSVLITEKICFISAISQENLICCGRASACVDQCKSSKDER